MRVLPAACIAVLLIPALAAADSKNPGDYALRIHIFQRSETNFYRYRSEEEAKGQGRANLFENGEPHAVDFTFDCSQKLLSSFGAETYPAKWKKPGQELTVLLPVFGRTGKYFTCDLKTDVKDFAYYSHNGLRSEPVADFKAWMVKHHYDPEHGLDQPTAESAARTSAPPPAPPPPAVQP